MNDFDPQQKLAALESETVRLRGEVHALRMALAKDDEALANTEIQMRLAYLATIQALVRAIEAKDPYTIGHSALVSKMAVALARRLALPDETHERLEVAGILLDVGKIGVPQEILVKEGELTPAERAALERHVDIGASIVEPILFPWEITNLIYQHHERLDGGGYPRGLRGDKIEFEARLLAVADSFVAMLADRAYRKAHSEDDILAYFNEQADKTFDRRCVAGLAELLADDREIRDEIAEFTKNEPR